MKTRSVLFCVAVLVIAPCVLGFASAPTAAIDLSTATMSELQAAMDAGTLTSEQLVRLYLARIEAYDRSGPKLNTVLALNARALDQARALDKERQATGRRSPLHGMVVLVKDVYDTYDMPTTGGFKPMATSQPSRDAFVVDRLRQAGAVILGKLNLSDWYGVAPTGASTLGGQVLSPYNPRKSPGSSSSGTGAAIASWFATVGLGSDTGGSIPIPSSLNNLVGFAMTHGLVSRTGLMWSSPRRENAGPMCRYVADCAAVLDAIAGYDAADLATEASLGRIPDQPYTSFVTTDGLRGKRLGVLREMVRSGPQHAEGVALFERALADFKRAGAVLVDPALTGLDLLTAQAAASASAYERVDAINKYLAGLPPSAPIRTVDEMLAKGGDLVKPTIIQGAKIGRLDHYAPLLAAYKQQDILRDALVDLMDRNRLDALVLPYRTVLTEDVGLTSSNPHNDDERNTISAYTGLPMIVVPGGFYPSDGMPFGVEFVGRSFSEPTLITLASGFEAVTRHRKTPPIVPPLAGESFKYLECFQMRRNVQRLFQLSTSS